MDTDVQHTNRFVKYPKIKILGDRDNAGILTTPGTVLVEEKVDGANFGFYTSDGIIYFCSHNQNLTDSEQIKLTGLPSQWRAIEPVLNAFNETPEAFADNIYTYGESLQHHRMKYDDVPGFIGFDVLDLNTNTFAHWSWAKNIVESMGLEFINVIEELNVPDDISHTPEGIEYLKTLYKKSAYKDGGAEGIVLKRYDTQQFAKIVDDVFKERIEPKEKVDATKEISIADMYATPARIEKIIYGQRDDGVEMNMSLMKTLFILVVDDILEEEGGYIADTLGDFDRRILGRIVAKRCVPVLKRIIMAGGK